MTKENEIKVVNDGGDAAVDTTATETSDNVASTEVNNDDAGTGDTQVKAASAEVESKMQGQIDNLNTALRQEREANKVTAKEYEDKFSQSQETIDKLKNVFSGEQEEETQPESLTMTQIESLLDDRDAKRKDEASRETRKQAIKTEVSTLEQEWNGTDGKPKYEDKTVLEWQESNEKLHLSPSEAFNEMNRDSIIDWEIKTRMAKKPNVENVEVPGGAPDERQGEETKIKSDEDLKNALMDAMDVASNENIN